MRQIQKERVKSMLKYKRAPCNLEYAKEIGRGGNGNVVLVKGFHLSEKRGKYFAEDSKLSEKWISLYGL